MEGGDAVVDAVRAVVDIEERRGGNRRVDAKVDAVKPHVRRGASWIC